MAQLVVMYKTPKDAAAFDKNYAEKHIPMAKKIPGLRKYEVSKGPVATPAGPSAYHLIATLTFDDLGAFKKRSAAPRGKPPRLTCRPSPPAAPRCSFSTPSPLEAASMALLFDLILRCSARFSAEHRRMPTQAPRPSSFEARFARTSG